MAATVLVVAGSGVLLAVTPGVGDAESRVHAQDAAHGVTDPGLPTPPKITAALVATEDAGFWTNHGIDPAGVLCAAGPPFRGGESDTGGATIEQSRCSMKVSGTDGQTSDHPDFPGQSHKQSAHQKKAIPMNVGHGEILCAAAGAAERANRTQEDITWYAIVLAILLVAVVVMLLRR